MTFRERLRRLFPASGLPYRLFDSSVLLIALSYLWYVGTEPSAVTRAALSDFLAIAFSPTSWGIGLMVAGGIGIACSYLSRWRWRALLVGYVVLAAAAAGWASALVLGAVLADPPHELFLKALGTALLYAWIARGMVADVLAADDLRNNP